MRRTGLAERSVQYHLEMLRESGLLVYVVKGTRRRGERACASEFARTVPPAFDEALGLRTVGEGPTRRVVGIEEGGRKLISKLAAKASRKVRKARKKSSKRAADGGGRCTPMVGGSSMSSSAGTTGLPSEEQARRTG